jgi:hypothetical protein
MKILNRGKYDSNGWMLPRSFVVGKEREFLKIRRHVRCDKYKRSKEMAKS